MAHFYDQPTLHLLQHGGSFDVCIDNIRYCGSKELLSWAVHTTATTCRELDISTNPPGYPEEKYDFLGVGYDHSNGTVSLGLKIRNKVEALVIPEGGSSTPLSVMLSILGVLVHASHILQLPLVRYYYFYKCVRRRAARASGVHDIVSWWAAAARDAERWRSDVLIAPPTHPHLFHNAVMSCVTDASLNGWGIVIYDNATMSTYSEGNTQPRKVRFGSFKRREIIALLEARAMLYGVQSLPEENIEVNFYTDNETLRMAIAKRRSKNFTLNAIIRNIFQHLEQCRITARFLRIASKDNPADVLTRL
jgi:hypothetical protein